VGDKNLVTTSLIKKRIITELFIDRIAALFMGETRIRESNYDGDQRVATKSLEEWRIP